MTVNECVCFSTWLFMLSSDHMINTDTPESDLLPATLITDKPIDCVVMIKLLAETR